MEEVLTRKEVNALVALLSQNSLSSWHISPKLWESLADRGFLEQRPCRRMDDRHKKIYSLSHKGRARLGQVQSSKRAYWLNNVQIRTLVHLLNGLKTYPSDRDTLILVTEGLITYSLRGFRDSRGHGFVAGVVEISQYGRDFLLTGARNPSQRNARNILRRLVW